MREDIFNGMGLIVVGGDNSFEYGQYKNSILEDFLPVKVSGARKEITKEINIVILLDISGSTSQETEGLAAIDIQKAIAIDLINQTRSDSKIAVVTFNYRSNILHPLTLLSQDERNDLYNEILNVKNNGGTNIYAGLKQSYSILTNVGGSRNVILISDGFSGMKDMILNEVKKARERGIQTHVVDIGDRTNRYLLEKIAIEGNGKYFRSTNKRSIKLIFKTDEKDNEKNINLLSLHPDHFILRKSRTIESVVTGYNQVIPKKNSLMLISTIYNNPILTVGRYGLGRIAVFSTGNPWANDIYDEEFFPRAINWVLGNKIDFPIIVSYSKDNIQIISKDKKEGFIKINNKYVKNIQPYLYNPGIYNFGGAQVAINYDDEVYDISLNEENLNMFSSFGAKIVKTPEQVIELSKNKSKEIKIIDKSLQPYILMAIVVLLLLEIAFRRLVKIKR